MAAEFLRHGTCSSATARLPRPGQLDQTQTSRHLLTIARSIPSTLIVTRTGSVTGDLVPRVRPAEGVSDEGPWRYLLDVLEYVALDIHKLGPFNNDRRVRVPITLPCHPRPGPASGKLENT
jgi:hypothetical protein